MKNRILIGNLDKYRGQAVNVAGWVDTLRKQKSMQFLVLRDHTGLVQVANFRNGDQLEQTIERLSAESTVEVGGQLVANEKVKLGGQEIQAGYVNVQSQPIEPIPITRDSALDSRMDYRHVDLRDPKKQLIFRVQTTAEHAMREFWRDNGFVEIHSPKLVSGASESGAELFQLGYFGRKASLAQSPQFYKQMAMMAGMDRVFEIGPVFRANPSFTSRHDTEFTSVDMEMSWIDSHEDVMQMEENWLQYTLSKVAAKHGDELKKTFGVETVIPQLPFPRVTMPQAYQMLDQAGHHIQREKGDLDPEGERKLGELIKQQHGHEFVFVTEYPKTSRAFYHMRPEDKPNTTNSFDLIWKGIEVTTGAQREHRYDRLLKQAQEKGVDVNSISPYLGFFKHGAPPHGGLGFGLSRMLMNLTGLNNVREVTFVYRGPNRLTP